MENSIDKKSDDNYLLCDTSSYCHRRCPTQPWHQPREIPRLGERPTSWRRPHPPEITIVKKLTQTAEIVTRPSQVFWLLDTKHETDSDSNNCLPVLFSFLRKRSLLGSRYDRWRRSFCWKKYFFGEKIHC